ncbi:CapA family protein [Streptomyces sp. NBC_00691]|uniref:CapA family protein n=1 Tax=Streptomyces sp. NBC_00691 TaxID=2903671 RepID=UPI003FA7DBCF
MRQGTFRTGAPELVQQAAKDAKKTGKGSAGLDFGPLMAGVRPVISKADLAICHMETPVGTPRGPFEGYPEFRVPPQILTTLKDVGYDTCSTASNHTYDHGLEAVRRTLDAMDEVGLGHAGSARTPAEAEKTNIRDVKGVKVAHLAYSWESFLNPTPQKERWAFNRIGTAEIKKAEARARQQGAEVVILSLHWGLEDYNEPSAPQLQLAERITKETGIDLVIGHHAHVVQPIQKLNGTWVAYSLGNLVARHSSPTGLTEEGAIGWSTSSTCSPIPVSCPPTGSPATGSPPTAHGASCSTGELRGRRSGRALPGGLSTGTRPRTAAGRTRPAVSPNRPGAGDALGVPAPAPSPAPPGATAAGLQERAPVTSSRAAYSVRGGRRRSRRRADMPLLGGIRPPIALLCVLVLALAGLTVRVLEPGEESAAPQAVLSSQRYFAEDGAIALRASVDERVADLQRTAAALSAGRPVAPERILSDLGRTYQKWTGTTVVDLESADVLATRGETIPLGWLDKDVLTGAEALTPRMVRLGTGDVRLMTMAVLDWRDRPQQLLIASSSLSVPAINLGPFRTMAVVARDGEILGTAGFEHVEALNSDQERQELSFLHRQMKRLSDQAAERTEQHPVRAKEPGSRGYPGVSGTLVGDDYNGRVATAGYASLASSDPEEKQSVAAGLGLTVVAVLPVVQEQSASPRAPPFWRRPPSP